MSRVKLDEVVLDRRLCDVLRTMRGLTAIDEIHVTVLGRIHELLVTTPEGYHSSVIEFATGILKTPVLRADIAAAARTALGMTYARMDDARLDDAMVNLLQGFEGARDVTGDDYNVELIAAAGLELVVVYGAMGDFGRAWQALSEVDKELRTARLDHSTATALAREVERARKTVMDLQAAYSRASAA